MLINAAFAALLITFGLGLYVLGELPFLVPYRRLLLHDYCRPVLVFTLLWLANLTAAIYLLLRSLTLARVGRKLAHLERHSPLAFPAPEDLSRLSRSQDHHA
jgi:uncharacterized membrane protein YbhN (UPF0104 family)